MVDKILAQNVGLVIGGSIDVMLAVGVLNWAMGTLYGLKRVSSVFSYFLMSLRHTLVKLKREPTVGVPRVG